MSNDTHAEGSSNSPEEQSFDTHIIEPQPIEEPPVDTPPEPPPKQTPLPWKQIFIVFTVFICDIFAFTTLTPYIGYMILDFNLVEDGDERKVGYYSGFITSSYAVAQLFVAFFWGYLSDKRGRRPILIIGIIGSCVTSLLFGFSTNIYWAAICRMLYGALNGNVGIFKTYIGEITDKSNQARAFSFIGLSVGIGNVIGPMISGFLARPHIQYPDIFSKLNEGGLSIVADLLTKFPYLLLNVIVFLINFVGLIMAILFLKETNKALLAKQKEKEEQNIKQQETEEIELIEHREEEFSTIQENDLVSIVEDDVEHGTEPNVETIIQEEQTQTQEMQILIDAQDVMLKFKLPFTNNERVIGYPKWWPTNEILRNRSPLNSVLLQGTFGLALTAWVTIMPLWVLLPYDKRGLDFSTREIGILSAATGVIMVIYQLFLCPWVLKKLGPLVALRISAVILFMMFPFIPEIGLLAGENSQVAMWIVLIVVNSLRIACEQTMATGLNIMVNNSVTSANMGRLNGIALSVGAAARAIAPVSSAALFSASTFITIIPFDIHLVFILISALYLSMVVLTIGLTKTINEPKEVKV
jgi:hypothetical protein